MASNWYIILGLDPEKKYSPEEIKENIAEKTRHWNEHMNDPTCGAEYRANLETVKKIAFENEEERERERLEAGRIVYEQVDKTLKLLGKEGSITEGAANGIAKKCNVGEAIVLRRASALGIEVKKGVGTEDYDKICAKYISKPSGLSKFEAFKELLGSVNAKDLYGFLFPELEEGARKAMKPAQLLGRSQELKKEAQKKKAGTAMRANTEKFCGYCEITFKDDAKKKEYDEYLEYNKKIAVLNNVKEIGEMFGAEGISKGAVSQFISELTACLHDAKAAKELFAAYCAKEKIRYAGSESAEDTEKKIAVCGFCDAINDISDGREKCKKCGKDLFINCPSCSARNKTSVLACGKCGFKFENIKSSHALCDLAENEMKRAGFAASLASLEEALHLWPQNPRIPDLKSRADEGVGKIGATLKLLNSAIEEKRYINAQKQYDAIKAVYPGYSDYELGETIKACTASAEEFFKRAKSSSSEKDVIDNCNKAYEFCADYPGVRELIQKYPPKPPANIEATPDGGSRVNIVKWTPAQSDSQVFYTLTRKKDGIPINEKDGDRIRSRLSVFSDNDADIEPGSNYFYAVFSERAGIFSSPAVTKTPVINLFEIKNAAITSTDSMIQLTWDKLPNGAVAEVLRVGGGGERLYRGESVSFTDESLANDREYIYKLRLVYRVGGADRATKGIELKGIPTRPPQAVDNFSVKSLHNDRFQVTWTKAPGLNILFYCSENRHSYRYEQVVPLSDVESKLTRLPINTAGADHAEFDYKASGLFYVTAVSEKSGSAVIGYTARICEGESVVIKSISADNDKISIKIEPPKGATSFVVLYGFSGYPADIEDQNAQRLEIPIKQYDHDGALVLKNVEKKDYFFSIYACFRRDGEKDYSPGCECLFRNSPKVILMYSIAYKKKFLAGSGKLIMEFESGDDSFVLPDMEILSAVGNMPLKRESSKVLGAVDSQSVKGTAHIEIPVSSSIDRNTFVRAVLKDSAMQSSYELRLNKNSNYKIS
jgi:hypothetical protein